jgi:hypothetical protein
MRLEPAFVLVVGGGDVRIVLIMIKPSISSADRTIPACTLWITLLAAARAAIRVGCNVGGAAPLDAG